MKSISGDSVKHGLLLSLFFFLLPAAGYAGDEASQCIWRPAWIRAMGLGDLKTEYYWYNTKITETTSFRLTAPRLPVTGYFSVMAYINGVPIGKFLDYEIVPENGSNPYPAPGKKSGLPMNTVGAYTVTIGGQARSSNHIPIPANAIGKQVEIALRYYSPIKERVFPQLRSEDALTGAASDCGKYESWYVNGFDVSQDLPYAKKSGEVVEFVRVGGQGIYPDADPYLASSAEKGGVTLLMLPKPPFPDCVGGNCELDRREKPAYSSIVVGSGSTLLTRSSLSDREMVADASGIVLLAAVADGVKNSAALFLLRRGGYQIMEAPRESNIFVYRQKLAPADYENRFSKVPTFPLQTPSDPEIYFASRYIEAAPVGIYCENNFALADCISSAMSRLNSARRTYTGSTR